MTRINGRGYALNRWRKLSTKSCGLPKLSALKWSRKTELSALIRSQVCAEMVAPLYMYLYSPVINTPVVGASPFVHNPVGLHTNRLALATDNLLKS